MGVTSVVNYPVPEGKSGQQTVDILQHRIELLGGIKTGNFNVDCESYQSQPPIPQRQVNVLHNSEHPASCFAVLDNGTCLIADSIFDLFMHKMKALYAPKKNIKVETRGQRYEIGDFIVKVGSVVLGQTTSFKGVIVEVEYSPCVIPKDCWDLMKEFMQGFMGSIIDNPPTLIKNKFDSAYVAADTVTQYLDHFSNFRKSAGQVQR